MNHQRKKIVNISILIVVVAVIIFGGLFFYKLNKLDNKSAEKKEKEKIATIVKEKSDLLQKVSEIYLFPGDEEPTIATVSDPELLKNQSFFSNSQVGDKVIIFAKAGKAILYRPSTNKIIDIVLIQSNTNNKDVSTSSKNKN